MLSFARAATLLVLGLLTQSRCPAAGSVPVTRPEELGFSSQRLEFIDRFYGEKVAQGELSGVVTLIARHGKLAHFSAVGFSDLEKQRKMRTDSLFRWYSMTKPLAATALMMLYEEGRFQMQDPVSKYIPEFAGLKVLRTADGPLDDVVPMVRPPTLQDLFRHTAGFSHGLTTDALDARYVEASLFGLEVSLAGMMSKLVKLPLRHQPGTKFEYSVSPDVQARLVEILSGMPFDEFLHQRLLKPLKMGDTGFWVPAGNAKRLATLYWQKGGRLIPLDESHGHPEGSVLYEPWSVQSYTVDHARKGGSFGLVGTAEDYWHFAQMMLNGGTLDGARILSPQVVSYMTRDHMNTIPILDEGGRPGGLGWGLGFAIMKDPAAAGYMSSAGTFFWAGAAGTQFWVDPKEDLVVVALIQHMATPAADQFWPQIRALVYSALID